MNHVFCRPALPADDQFIAWVVDNMERNVFDPEILKYKATKVIEAFAGDKTLLYLPTQEVTMLESLAINPANRGAETAAALKAVTQTVAWEARRKGQGEIYFMCADRETAEFASHHGYDRLETPVYRMKLK